MSHPHRFSVVLPVRNGGQYLQQCVASILAQTYPHFDLIVLDNASTDGSLAWIRTLDDPRVRVYESAQSLNIEENWSRILSVPKQTWMTMTGHDDLFDPNYLDVMANLIDRHPDAGLYQAHFRLIDAQDQVIRHCVPMPESERADAFLSRRLAFQRDSFGTGYVFRSADYEKIGGIPAYKKLMFADDALWMQLMLPSYKATASEECFAYRVHAQSTSYAPDWASVYDALKHYQMLLFSLAQREVSVKGVLQAQWTEYLIFWYQWAYFSTQDAREQACLRVVIQTWGVEVSDALRKMGRQDANQFLSDVQRQVFSPVARYYWLGKRLWRWGIRRVRSGWAG